MLQFSMHHTKLRSFHAVAVLGGFTSAANALNVGQPTVTNQVRALEEYFDVELFYRRGRIVELTDIGKELFKITLNMFSIEEDAINLLSSIKGMQTGYLRVGAVGPFHVTKMLASYSQKHPDVTLSVAFGNSQKVLNDLRQFQVDIAVLAQQEEDPFLHSRLYSRHPVVVIVNADHPFARLDSIPIERMEGQRMVLREVGSTTRRAFEKALATAGVSIDKFMEIGSREAIWVAVADGIGISVVSRFEFIPHPKLRVVPFANAEVFTETHVTCLESRKNSRLIKAFLKEVEEIRQVCCLFPDEGML